MRPMLVEAGDGGVHLNFKTYLTCESNGVHRPLKASLDAPKFIVALLVVAVETDSEPDETCVFHVLDGRTRHFFGAGRSHCHAQADLSAVAEDVKDVGPLDRIAARDDGQDGSESACFLEKGEGFLGS